MKRFVCALAVFATLATSCMTTRREEEMKASIAKLEMKVNELNSQLPKNIENVRNEAENTQKHFQATKSDIEDLRKELSLSQGAIDELRVKLSRVQEASVNVSDKGTGPAKNAELDEFLIQVSRRLARVELLAQNLKDKVEHQKKDPRAEKQGKYKTVNELGKALAAAFVGKDYKKVISIASPVISSDASREQVEVALQFRGEAYFALQDYEHAAADFSEFVDRFPRSEKKPRALLLSGDSYIHLKQPYTARSFYGECVRNFADREECKASKDRLTRMGL